MVKTKKHTNNNASERSDKRYRHDDIRILMRKLKGGKIEQAYEEPDIKKDTRRKDSK